MRIFGKTKFIKTIAVILIFLTLFNFIMPKPVYAGLLQGIKDFFGGILFSLLKLPVVGILKLFFFLFDALAVRY